MTSTSPALGHILTVALSGRELCIVCGQNADRCDVATRRTVCPTCDPTAFAFRCIGLDDCTTRVARRNTRCAACEQEEPRRRREERLAVVRQGLSPDGGLDFCVAKNATYAAATRKALGAARRIGDPTARATAIAIIEETAWSVQNRGVLILGPTGYGKSKVLTAIGLRILCEATAPGASPEALRFAMGIRYISGMALARAAREQRLGVVDQAFASARDATLLLFDEVGFEDGRLDAVLVRDLLRARYEPKYRPTIMASGGRLEEANQRYGEAALRTIWERGSLVDLWLGVAPAAGDGERPLSFRGMP